MQNIKFRIALLFCLLIPVWNLPAQVGTWKAYLAYHNANIVIETPNYVFGVYDGSLLSYSHEDGEIRTYSKKNGLNDTDIKFMTYHAAEKALVLVYANANIDIFLGENNVYNLPFIKNNPSIQDKTVYNLEIIGNFAYLSTSFGIVVIDVKRKEIKDSYRFGSAVKSVCQNGDYLYAATSNGIRRALITDNLLDGGSWKSINNVMESLDAVNQILFFKDRMIIFAAWNTVFYIRSDGEVQPLLDNARLIKVLNNQLVALTNSGIYFYNDITDFVEVPLRAFSIDCINSKNQYWLASGETGITGLKKSLNSSEYEIIASDIKVNSPKRNLNAYMTFAGNKLLVTGGGKSADRLGTPGTLMIYEDGQWYNFDEEAISKKTGLSCLDFMSAAVDPSDPDHYYVGSWGEGLYEFKKNEFVNLYTYENSSLQTAIPGNNRFIRVDGLIFDKNNNLYMVNGGVANGLSVFVNQKEWKSSHYPPLASADVDRILISSTNQKWFNFFRGSKAGIMVLDERGTISDTSDDKYAFSGAFFDQQGNDVKSVVYLAMAEDQNGLIWVGTDNGPIFFTSMEQVNNGICHRIISSDQYNEGFRPLEGIKITAIAVDGGNRKWMGSAGSGVFVIDQSNVSKTHVENYTSENSSLLSNTINSIAINDNTGEIFIGTDKGLCSYRSEAIKGKPDYSEVLAFPNPVRPSSDSQVVITGLMRNSTVKITDLTGNLIQQGVSMGGQYLWNCADRFGNIVKAGIYLVFMSTPNGEQGAVAKIMVIK